LKTRLHHSEHCGGLQLVSLVGWIHTSCVLSAGEFCVSMIYVLRKIRGNLSGKSKLFKHNKNKQYVLIIFIMSNNCFLVSLTRSCWIQRKIQFL